MNETSKAFLERARTEAEGEVRRLKILVDDVTNRLKNAQSSLEEATKKYNDLTEELAKANREEPVHSVMKEPTKIA